MKNNNSGYKQKKGLYFWLSGLLPSIVYVTIYVINAIFPNFFINRFIAIGIFLISLIISFILFIRYENEQEERRMLHSTRNECGGDVSDL
jgi:positive regulator of sigma E activity